MQGMLIGGLIFCFLGLALLIMAVLQKLGFLSQFKYLGRSPFGQMLQGIGWLVLGLVFMYGDQLSGVGAYSLPLLALIAVIAGLRIDKKAKQDADELATD